MDAVKRKKRLRNKRKKLFIKDSDAISETEDDTKNDRKLSKQNHAPKCSIIPKKSKKNQCNKNITENRITLKHGVFSKGVRTETFKRVVLSEEYKARLKGNLHKIIDLANGKLPDTDDDLNNCNSKDVTTLNKIIPSPNDNNNSPINEQPKTNKIFTPTPNIKNRELRIHPKITNSNCDVEQVESIEELFKENSDKFEKYISKNYIKDTVGELKKYFKKTYETSILEDTKKIKRISVRKKISCIKAYDTNMECNITLNPLQYLDKITGTSEHDRKKINKNLKNKANVTNLQTKSNIDNLKNKMYYCQDTSDSNMNLAKCKKKNLVKLSNKNMILNDDLLKSNNTEDECEYDNLISKTPEITFYPRKFNF